jgi:Rod binding domain-containing protein
MSTTGTTGTVNTHLTLDNFQGLRRFKPSVTSLSNISGPHRSKPLNTSLPSAAPVHRTKLNAADLRGVRAKKSPQTQHEKLVAQTKKWVGQTFYGTMLKQMRESPFKSDLFDGGRGGQAFGAMYDQELSEHLSQGAGKQLVDSIVNRIEQRSNAVRQQLAAKKKAA